MNPIIKNFSLFILLSACFDLPSMQLPEAMQYMRIKRVRRCDRSQAETYYADLDNGELVEARKYTNGTIICLHMTSALDTSPTPIDNDEIFPILKTMAKKR